MNKLFASWVPGCAVVAQNMGSGTLNSGGWNFGDCNGHREGTGVTFYIGGGCNNWFHVPIPTPVIVENQRARLGRVMVLFNFPKTVTLDAVHVWDGPNKILEKNVNMVTGDHGTDLDADNVFDVNHDGIKWGVVICLHVSALKDAEIQFISAGADFFHNV